jgi:hypothetical protein
VTRPDAARPGLCYYRARTDSGGARMSTSRDDESGHDVLPVLGGIAWRLIKVAVVVVGAALVFRATTFHTNDPIWKMYIASMKSDLRGLVTAEESYFADNATFTATIGNLVNANGIPSYEQSPGNTLSITSATSTGWSATAKSTRTTHICGIYVGSATPPVPGFSEQKDGEPKCL